MYPRHDRAQRVAGEPRLGGGLGWRHRPAGRSGPVTYPRGRTLNGSGAINGMAHVRGNRRVYDNWAAQGAKGWAFADLLPYFRRTESAA